MLTKKHFKAVAEIIKTEYDFILENDYRDVDSKDTVTNIIYKLADYFAMQNLRFDRERFMEACGLEE